MSNVIRNIFPFFVTIQLWYLSHPVFNPFGVLVLIPIFYYMFCDYRKYWFGFGFFMCFLLDFNAGTSFLFCSVFLMMNALNIFFGVLENSTGYHIRAFNMFLGVMALFLFIYGIFGIRVFFSFLLGILWLYVWLFMLYIPMVALFRWVNNDR